MSRYQVTVKSRDGKHSRAVAIYVYDTEEELYKAASDWNGEPNDWEGTNGLTQSGWLDSIDEKGEVTSSKHIVLIRLMRPHLGSAVVSHECCHAAIRIWQAWHKSGLNIEEDDIEKEEEYCYLLSDLVYLVVNKLYAKGYYK